jgi:transposase
MKEQHMVVIGGDSHKRTHTFVAVDELGRRLSEKTVPATTDGHLAALAWAGQWNERRWALEDCRHLTRRLEADLLRAGDAVVRVPPKMMAAERRATRSPGKSDPIDAEAVARAALRDDDLPVAQLEGEARRVKLLVDHREDLVAERTRMQARLRWHLHELMPELDLAPKALNKFCHLDRVAAALAAVDGTVAAIATELVVRIRDVTVRCNQLEREITAIAKLLVPTLLELPGCGPLTAAKIVGEVAGADRFKSKAAFARWNGTAPIPVWTGSERFRLSRSGNRQVNAALHRIAITQWRGVGQGRPFIEARMATGKTKTAAIRLLRRRLSDEVLRRLLIDHADAVSTDRTDVLPIAA